MRTYIFITGTALGLCASPVIAGGVMGSGAMHGNTLGGVGKGLATRASNSPTSCLCNTAGTAVRAVTSGRSIGRMPGNARGVRLLTNSVVGLNGLGAVRGVGHGNGRGGQAIGLAGVVTGGAGSVSTIGRPSGGGHGVGLAGSVAVAAAAGLAGHSSSNAGLLNVGVGNATGSHGRSAVNVVALNRNAGMAGRVANVAVLNGTGPNGRSAINVAALNGNAGKAGRIANVSVLNGSGSHGRSAVNVAALNRAAGSSGKIVNLALLNGHGGAGAGSGIRLINGIPCLPDGTPLTGAAAAAAMARFHSSPHHDGQHGTHTENHQAAPAASVKSGPMSHQQAVSASQQVARGTPTRGSSGWDRRETPNEK
jgi:hypothetical protein